MQIHKLIAGGALLGFGGATLAGAQEPTEDTTTTEAPAEEEGTAGDATPTEDDVTTKGDGAEEREGCDEDAAAAEDPAVESSSL